MTEFKDEYIILRLANKELMEELLYLRDGIEHEEVDADGNSDHIRSYGCVSRCL